MGGGEIHRPHARGRNRRLLSGILSTVTRRMGAVTPGDRARAVHMSVNTPVTVISKVTRNWREFFQFVIGMLLLVVAFSVGIRLVPPDAVHISQSVEATGHILAQRTIADPRIVADYYARLNSMPATPGPMTCPLRYNPVTTYTVTFTRWGLPIEGATLADVSCPFWWIIRGGVPERPRFDYTHVMQPVLAQVQP
jgi:hypothetical protein